MKAGREKGLAALTLNAHNSFYLQFEFAGRPLATGPARESFIPHHATPQAVLCAFAARRPGPIQ